MINHATAAAAHERAQKLRDIADVATTRASKRESSIFSQAFAEAKHREALAAVQSATAQSIWASWTMKVRP